MKIRNVWVPDFRFRAFKSTQATWLLKAARMLDPTGKTALVRKDFARYTERALQPEDLKAIRRLRNPTQSLLFRPKFD